jgi:hypothetical protein
MADATNECFNSVDFHYKQFIVCKISDRYYRNIDNFQTHHASFSILNGKIIIEN